MFYIKPKILITTQYEDGADRVSLRLSYTDAVISAGGLALAVPPTADAGYTEELADAADAILLTGGDDVVPELYGEERTERCGPVSYLRDAFELKLVGLAVQRGIPTLGICRGIQVMNVALGGSLHQHMDGHMQRLDKSEPSHFVTITGSPLLECYGGRGRVNSFHHQALKRVADGLRICAVSDDGCTEAVFMPDHPFFVGVQWHPEHMTKSDTGAARLFEAFASAAGLNMKK